MAPKWSPDGSRFVYTSFRSQFPDVYLVNLDTGEADAVGYPGDPKGAPWNTINCHCVVGMVEKPANADEPKE